MQWSEPHVGTRGFEMRVALPRGGAVSGGVVLSPDHRPGRTPVVILAPGAGSDRRHPSLTRIQDALADAGWTTATFDFPYREAGRRVPDPRPVLEACWRAVLDAVRKEPRLAPPRLVIGGRSMGGRMASHVAADGANVDALLFLAFPLHPAGRPGTERAAHLARIEVPMLFVQGTRDTLADPALLAGVLHGLPSATLHEIVGADHGFRIPRRSGRDDASVHAEVLAAVTGWLDNLPE
jgi:predicted alpha/beta-hydrolase family hydrolase